MVSSLRGRVAAAKAPVGPAHRRPGAPRLEVGPVASSEAAAGPVQTGGASTQLFIRQTSGLVRELGIPAAVGISLASVAVVNTFINFNAGLTDFPK